MGEQQCEIERIYDEKCAEIYAYKAGKTYVRRTKKEKKLMRGVPPDMQQQIMPLYRRRGRFRWNDHYKIVLKEGKWNNARCQYSRVPICQKPRGQVYDKYIAVRGARTYSK